MKRFLTGLGAVLNFGYAGIAGTCLMAAQAGTITETDRASVLDGNVLVETFGSVLRGPITTDVLNSATDCCDIPPPFILQGVTYSTPIGTGFFFNIDGGAGFTGGLRDAITEPNPLTVQFAIPQIAFGFDTNSIMGPTFEITINFSGGGSLSKTLNIPNTLAMTGFGFISNTDDITSAVIVKKPASALRRQFGLRRHCSPHTSGF